MAVTDGVVAVLQNDYVAENREKGSLVQTTDLAPLDHERLQSAPVARFHGLGVVCTSPLQTRGIGAETRRGGHDLPPPDVRYGDAQGPGRNAFTSNGNNDKPRRGNFLLTNIDAPIPASGNQWARCGTTSMCDVVEVRKGDISPPDPMGELVDLGVPLAGPRAGDPVVLRVTPARPQAGDVVRVFGDNFNAIEGNPVRSDCDAVGLPACSSDADCRTGPCVNEMCPCAIESPVVQQRNRGRNGNRVTIRSATGKEVITLYPDAVTPTMLAFHMPFDCFAPLTLEVTKRELPPEAAAPAIALCDPGGCGDEPEGFPCDDRNPCTGDDHCTGDGRCVAGAPRAGALCRQATGPCDLEETCDGVAPDCPPDVLRDVSAVCRPAAGVCDVAEHCTGSAASCPEDVKSLSECRAAAGDCDVADVCDGVHNACPDDLKRPDGFVCRAAAGICDVAEACDGVHSGCPPDRFVKAGTVCRGATGVCDLAEACDGSSAACPPDRKSTAICRNAMGDCDVAERCDGVTDACPVDVKQPSGVVCRAAAGVCDVAETCDGIRNGCPPDHFVGAGVVCRPTAGPCDVQDVCDGTRADCPDAMVPAGTVCRGAAGVCDAIETCDGRSAACPADAKGTAECRDSAGDCDVAERCDGVHDGCPADRKRPRSDICRAVAGDCDVAEHCDGLSNGCPPDGVMAAGAACRPAAGACDLSEFCDGRSVSCPADVARTTGPTALTCHVDECAQPRLHKRLRTLANRIEHRLDRGKAPKKRQMVRLGNLLEACGLDVLASAP